MKFLSSKNGQAGLLLACSLVFASCNKEEFAPMEEYIAGVDSYCSQAQDAKSCIDLGTVCQPAYEPSSNEMEEPKFAACVGNWYYDDPVEGGTDGSTSGGSTGGTDGSTSGGSTGGTDGSTSGGSTGGTDGSTSGGSTGGTDGSTSGGSTGGTDGGEESSENPPSIQETIDANCSNLDSKYLWVKKDVKNKKVVKVVKKVKVCHQHGNQEEHTILIACPALKGHRHHDDYIGICK